jgi:hypothetical protein
MNSQLMIGILLIAAGILLAVVAYWVISSGGSRDDPESTLEGDEFEEGQTTGTEASEQDPPKLQEDELSSGMMEPAEETLTEIEDELEIDDILALEELPAEDLQSATVSESLEMEEAKDAAVEPSDMQPHTGPRIAIASLLRDEVTGKLIVRVGNTEYQTPDELRNSDDWTRIEYAASDLQTWVAKDTRDPPTIEREADAVAPKPTSMIEQINAILQEKIEASGRTDLGVRLLESPSGAARVLIGVQSYDLADVPDEDIRRLIQESVAIWEADQ